MFSIACRVHDDNLPPLSAHLVKLRSSDKYLSLSVSSDVKFDCWHLGFFRSSVTSFLTDDIKLCTSKVFHGLG